jgi:hypothetical protein
MISVPGSSRLQLYPALQRAACTVIVALLLAGCARTVPEQTKLMKAVDADVTAADLRVRVFEFARRTSATVEATADSIRRVSADAEVSRRALLWKTNAIPAFEEAALGTDPLGAATESYVLAERMRRLLETGTERNAFGAQQPLAVAGLMAIERDALAILSQSFEGDTLPSRVRTGIDNWLRAHPESSLSVRRPGIAADLPAIAAGRSGGLLSTVGSIEQSVGGLQDRLAFLNEHLMKQVRWNAALMSADVLEATGADTALGSGLVALDRLGGLAAGTPALLRGERAAVLREVNAQRIATLRDVDAQRIATLRDVDAQRIATLAAVSGEREALLAGLRSERIATVAAMDTMLDRAFDRSAGLVDRVFLRAAQLLAAALVALLLIALLGLGLWRGLRRA